MAAVSPMVEDERTHSTDAVLGLRTPVVVLGRPYTIYNKVLNSNVPALLREQGAMAAANTKTLFDAGVTIAFPQRDVHLDVQSPIQVQLDRTDYPAESASLRAA